MRTILQLLVFMLMLSCTEKKNESVLDVNQTQVTLPYTSQHKKGVLADKKNNLQVSSVLATQTLFQKVEVLVPRSFKIMDEETLELKYPLKRNSSFQVFTDEDATVNIALEHLPNIARLEDLPAIKQIFEQQFNQPSIDFKKSEIQKINGRDFIILEMITPAMDTEIYNLMFVTSLNNRLFMGTFNCTIEKMKHWRPIAEQIVNSIKVKE